MLLCNKDFSHGSDCDFLLIVILTPYCLNEFIPSGYIKGLLDCVHCSPQEGDRRGGKPSLSQ